MKAPQKGNKNLFKNEHWPLHSKVLEILMPPSKKTDIKLGKSKEPERLNCSHPDFSCWTWHHWETTSNMPTFLSHFFFITFLALAFHMCFV